MLKNAVYIAKGTDEEKVPVSLKVPKSLKEEFETVCKNESVSMNSMFCALAQIAVNESKALIEDSEQSIINQYLKNEIKQLEKYLKSLPDYILEGHITRGDEDEEEAYKMAQKTRFELEHIKELLIKGAK